MSMFRSRDRVRIAEANVKIIESLGERTDAARVFQNQAEAVAFAASVGYHFNKFAPVTDQSSKAILFQQIDHATDLGADLVEIFAIAHSADMELLDADDSDEENNEEQDAVLIFEGYVNGGLSYLEKQDFDAASPIKAVRALIRTLDPELSDILNRL